MLTLQETTAYRNPRVINKFRTQYAVGEPEADELFVEMLKWLWLCARAREDREANLPDVPRVLNIQSGLIIIDELWHLFILHTRDYVDFCERHFGFYLHHYPGHPAFEPPTEEDTAKELSYIYDNVEGEATLNRWYVDYAERYAPEKIGKLQRARIFGRPCEVM